METHSPHDVTRLLMAWRGGDHEALDQLISLVHSELRRMARGRLRGERNSHTLRSAALVNEVYLRLVNQYDFPWQNRAHFFAVAAKLMRQILIDYARAHQNGKRGGKAIRVVLEEAEAVAEERSAEMVALDDALSSLSEIDRRKSDIIELRFFGGLSIEETAEVLKLSPGTVMREWTLAKAWIKRELSRR